MDVKGTMPHRVGSSRGLPHLKKALETLFRTYPAFISHLDTTSHQNAKAGGIAKMLHSLPIIHYASLLKVTNVFYKLAYNFSHVDTNTFIYKSFNLL